MLPRSIWIIATLLAVATVTNSYTHRTHGSLSPPTTSIPQNTRDWDRSDAKEAWDQEGRIINPGDYAPFQSQGRRDDYEPTDESIGPSEASRSLFKPPNDRTPVNFDPNPNQGHHHHQGNFQAVEYNRDYPQNYNGQPQFNQEQLNQGRPTSFNSDTSGLNNGQFFKVQRNPDGKLNVVFNDTAIPHEKDDEVINLNNRGSGLRPPVQIGPINTPARDIIFPEDPRFGSPRKMQPRCAEPGKLFCTAVENYPKDIVSSALQSQSMKYQQLFGEDLLPENINSPNITQRIDAPGEESLCFSTERIIYPQAGLTKDNNWSFIVNQPNYTQGIRVEECSSPGKPCQMADNFPNGYVTECRQKYIFRQLLSVNGDGVVAKDLFQLPSCCKCILKNKSFS